MEYDVRAELELETARAQSGARAAAKEIKQVEKNLQDAAKAAKRLEVTQERAWQKQVRHFQRMGREADRVAARNKAKHDRSNAAAGATGMSVAQEAVAGFMAIGAAMQGLSAGFAIVEAGMNAVGQFIASGVKYTAELETMQIGLSSVFSSIEGVSFTEAKAATAQIYDKLVAMAAVSPVGPKELQEIFVGLYAPLRQAGVALDDILTSSNDASAALGALGVDIAQGARDMAMIAEGRAGMQVKTFVKLNQAGAFGKSMKAEDFNAKSAGERAKLLQAALKKVGGEAAAAFGQSFVGLSSTLEGLYQEGQRAFVEPILNTVTQLMATFSAYWIKVEKPFEMTVRLFGQLTSTVLGPIFDKGLAMAMRLSDAALKWMGPVDALAEGAYQLQRGAGSILGAGAYAAGGMAGAGVGAGIGGMLGGLAGTIVGLLTGTGPLGTAVGTAAGSAGGAVVGAGAGLALTAVFEVLSEHMETVAEIAWSLYEALAPSLWEAFMAIWPVLHNTLRLVGAVVLTTLVTAFTSLMTVFTVVSQIVADMAASFGFLNNEGNMVDLVIKTLIDGMKAFAESARDVGNAILLAWAYFSTFGKGLVALSQGDVVGAAQAGISLANGAGYKGLANRSDIFGLDAKMIGRGGVNSGTEFGTKDLTKNGATVNIGSVNFNVQQSFKDADPDRIVRSMFADLEEQAERVLASPFGGVFAR